MKKSHYHINDISQLSNSPLLLYNDIQDDTEHDKNNDKIYLKHDNQSNHKDENFLSSENNEVNHRVNLSS